MASGGSSCDSSGEKTAKLDMSHGFVHHIRRNQKSRDNYDKEQKAKQGQRKPRHTQASVRPKKPDQMVYRPRAKRDTHTDSQKTSTSDDLPRRKALFRLEYEAKNGDVTDIIIYEEDDPRLVAERFGTQLGLSNELKDALYIHLVDEIKKSKHLLADKK
ncbi:UPF0561 protein C2orf68 homolog [Branchiostoma floridae]|uniref:UPF0561 protein C2orf68 homolog n=1 Tax=Branchiostoma floridae TaxID=7739 RepID=A0A9J7KT46_BRAFL|nr:UPF0561 protein C2orf68 homolog [Branchiostoma floridae]